MLRDQENGTVLAVIERPGLCDVSQRGSAAIDGARQQLMNRIFSDWQEKDVKDLFRLVRQYAESVKGKTPSDR